MTKNNWTKEETIVAFNVYCKIPFKDSSKTNPIVIRFAELLGRSPSALNMKIGNFGRLDPDLRRQGIVGLANGSKLEQEVWDEFHGNWEKLSFESERIILKLETSQNLQLDGGTETDLGKVLETEKDALVKQRVNQSFFRNAVLSAYNNKCCITELSIPNLLIASHIVPWSINAKERLNPRNGLCLNALHDKAFDSGLITVNADLVIKVSNQLMSMENDQSIKQMFINYNGKKIYSPEKFKPHREFLNYHYNNIFKK